jgi:hypothetical protein
MRAAVDESDREHKGLLLPVFTVALVLALFAGIVWLVADGVSSFNGNNDGRVAGEGARLMESVGALIKCTRVINNALPCKDSGSYDFLADIDGDTRTGQYGVPGYGKGLERVVIYRSGEKSTELRVDVYTAPGQRPRSTALTRDLDSNDPQAFRIDCACESPAKNGETTNQRSQLHESPVRIRVVLVLGPREGEAAGSRKFREVNRLRALVRGKNP